jgi:hypothetical protein
VAPTLSAGPRALDALLGRFFLFQTVSAQLVSRRPFSFKLGLIISNEFQYCPNFEIQYFQIG